MTATLTIRTPGNGWQWDPETRQDVPAQGEVIWDGAGLVQATTNTEAFITSGGEELATIRHIGKAPWHVEGLAPGQTVTVTGGNDPDLPREFTILALERNTLALTCRRFALEEVAHVQHRHQ